MARQVVWSYEATADLETIANYIARDSKFYAELFVQENLDASPWSFSPKGRQNWQKIKNM